MHDDVDALNIRVPVLCRFIDFYGPVMSISFGLKASTPRKKAAGHLAAFSGAEDDEDEVVLSEADKLAESERLQVRSFPALLHFSSVAWHACTERQLDHLLSDDRFRAMLLLMQRSILLHCKHGTKLLS